ncbi:hypothetical protein M2162_003849 [Streptomyces sp. SAI-041]|nr:hypothetical protein [Streptomyces sp. SAI-041]
MVSITVELLLLEGWLTAQPTMASTKSTSCWKGLYLYWVALPPLPPGLDVRGDRALRHGAHPQSGEAAAVAFRGVLDVDDGQLAVDRAGQFPVQLRRGLRHFDDDRVGGQLVPARAAHVQPGLQAAGREALADGLGDLALGDLLAGEGVEDAVAVGEVDPGRAVHDPVDAVDVPGPQPVQAVPLGHDQVVVAARLHLVVQQRLDLLAGVQERAQRYVGGDELEVGLADRERLALQRVVHGDGGDALGAAAHERELGDVGQDGVQARPVQLGGGRQPAAVQGQGRPDVDQAEVVLRQHDVEVCGGPLVGIGPGPAVQGSLAQVAHQLGAVLRDQVAQGDQGAGVDGRDVVQVLADEVAHPVVHPPGVAGGRVGAEPRGLVPRRVPVPAVELRVPVADGLVLDPVHEVVDVLADGLGVQGGPGVREDLGVELQAGAPHGLHGGDPVRQQPVQRVRDPLGGAGRAAGLQPAQHRAARQDAALGAGLAVDLLDEVVVAHDRQDRPEAGRVGGDHVVPLLLPVQ